MSLSPERLERAPAIKEQVMASGAWSVGGWAVGFAVGVPVTIASVRLMSHAAYGSLSVATAAAGLLAIVGAFGLADGIAYHESRRRVAGAGATLSSANRVARVCTVLAAVAGAAAAVLLDRESGLHGAGLAMAVLLPLVVTAPFAAVCLGAFRAALQPKPPVVAAVTGATVTGLATVVLLASGLRTGPEIAAASSAGAVVTFLLLMRPFRREHGAFSAQAGAPGEARPLISFSLAMLTNSLTWTAISMLDVFVIGLSKGGEAAGFYAPLSALAGMILVIFGLVGSYLLPALTRLIASNLSGGSTHVFHATSRWGIVLAAPFVAGVLVAPRWPLTLMYGSSFGHLTNPMRILAVAAAVHVAFGYNGIALEAQGRPGLVARRSLIALTVNILACVVLIPRFGLSGGAWSTLAAICTVNLLCSVSLWRQFHIALWDGSLALTVVCFVGSLATASGVAGRWSGPAWAATCAAVCFVALVTALPSLAAGYAALRVPIGVHSRGGRPTLR